VLLPAGAEIHPHRSSGYAEGGVTAAKGADEEEHVGGCTLKMPARCAREGEDSVKPEVLALLCDPETREPLEFKTEPGINGKLREFLVNASSGKKFSIQDGIPLFINPDDVTGSNRRYQALYNRFAPVYDLATTLFARLKGASVETRLREYLDELEVKDSDQVLEVSVGTGRNLRFLPPAARYFGLDISWGMLKQCQKNVRKWNRNTELFLGAAENLPFKDQSFDVVFHAGGINFFNDKARAVNEMVRVAKPGTKLVIVDETEELAQKYQSTPLARQFYNRHEAIIAPEAMVPPGMSETRVKNVAGGDLYCLTFKKPC
jgi:ubiquinone/menaquinone biosynthesis C-methylase UbiE